MIKFLLALFRPFRRLIESAGADYDQFIQILELKLTIDNRKQGRKQGTEKSLIVQSLGQIVMGFVFSIATLMIQSEFTFFFLMHSVITVMMAMLIISEFTTILFDTSENSIIQPLPVKGNTLNLARNAHVFLYLMLIAFNISLATMIIGLVKFGLLAGVLFLVSVIFNVLFTLFLANLLYLGLMNIASGEQLKTILMYFQIGIAILFMAGYQLGTNMIDRSQIMNMTLPVHWYTHLMPPAIFSGFIEALSAGLFDPTHLLFVAEAILIPFAAFFVTTRFLTPVFNRKLLNLESGDRATKVTTGTGKTSAYYRLMENLFTTNNDEKAAFQLSWRMSGYERLFKQSFFPSLGYVIIMVAVQFFKKDAHLKELAQTNIHLLSLYMFMIVSFTLANSLLLGNNRQAEWIFRILPVESPADYFKGFIKAVFVRFFNPFFLLFSIGLTAFFGLRIIPDVVIAWMVIYLATTLIFYAQTPQFPFSLPKGAAQGGKNMVKVFAVMFAATILGFAHFFLIKWEYFGHVLLIIVYALAIWATNRSTAYKLIRWDKIDFTETYN